MELLQFSRQGMTPDAHMYPLNKDAGEWRELTQIVAKLFKLSSNEVLMSDHLGGGVGVHENKVHTPYAQRGTAIQRAGGKYIPL